VSWGVYAKISGEKGPNCGEKIRGFYTRATIVADYKAKNSVNSVNHPPYSPDLAPCDFFLFPKLKLPLRGTRFSSIDDIKRNSQRVLKAIPESAYQKCMEDWFRRFHMCIANDGDYFEGDKINFDK